MYFHTRTEAGEKLASELNPYQSEQCVVVALSHGAVFVGDVIARQLGCQLTLMLSEGIHVPGEHVTVGTVNQSGGFTYNQTLSPGEVQDYYEEFHGYIEDQKREKFAAINRLVGGGGLLDREMLRDRIIILVSDGLKNGVPLDAAVDYLKPIKIKRLVIATPIASVQAVDRMHILADELHCLGVTDNFISTDHYYDVNDVPDHDRIIEWLKNRSTSV